MLKRLLTAVFVLGLFLTLSGTAFSSPTNVPGQESAKEDRLLSTPTHAVPSHAKTPVGYTSSGAFRRDPTLRPVPAGSAELPGPSTNDADTTACYLQYYRGATSGYLYSLTDGAGVPTGEELSVRYDLFNAPNYVGVVDQIQVRMYEVYAAGAACPVRITLWSDVGNLPGAVLYQATFNVPPMTAPGAWVTFTLPTPLTITGPYHASVGLDPTAVVGDDIVLIINASGVGRTSDYWGGVWYTMPAAFGQDYDLWMKSHQCEHYTKCASRVAFGGSVYLQDIPATYWSDGSTLNGWAQKFVATAPETLKAVRIQHYAGYGLYDGTSTNAVDVMVFADDGTGQPTGVPLATVNLPGGAGLFPTTGIAGSGWNVINVDFSAFNLVFRGPYHVGAKMTSNNAADGALLFGLSYENPASPNYNDQSGGSVNFTAPGASWQNTGLNTTWMTDPNGWGFECGWASRVTTCVDEFALCKTQLSYEGGATRLLYMDNCGDFPPIYGSRIGIAGHFAGEQVNRVEKIRFQMTDETYDGYPDVPNSVRVSIYSSAGGDMGSVIWSTVLTNADITMMPGWTEVVIPGGVQALNDWFVAVEPLATQNGDIEWYYFARQRIGDDPSMTALVNGGMWVKLCADGLWHNNVANGGANDNFICQADYCSIPPTEWVCGAADNFATNSHDYGRTGHSNVALSDAYCDLNPIWSYTDAGIGNSGVGGGAPSFTSPIIYENFVVCAFNSKYIIFDLTTGAVLATLSGNSAPYFVNVSGIRCNPTIATITVGGTPTPVLFYGGGTTNGQFVAVKMVAPFDTLWTVTNSNRAAKGYAVTLGNTSYSAPVVLNIGGVDMVFWNTNDGKVWAANAATGNKIWGPTTLVAGSFRNLASDGANLYAATIANPPTYIDGDVYCINAADGVVKWQLSTAGGYKGDVLQPGNDAEIFPDQLAVYGGEVYTVMTFQVLNVAPNEGLLYRLNAANGAVITATATGHFYEGGSALTIGSNLVVDAKRVIVVGGYAWTSIPMAGTLLSYNRFTGALDWRSTGGPVGTGVYGRYYGNGFLTCEPGGVADYLVVGDDRGYLSFINADNGQERFQRRIDNAQAGWTSRWGGAAIGKNGTVVAVDQVGSIYGLAKTVDIPRLEIKQYAYSYPVPYGSPASTTVTFAKAFTNTGCLPLTVTLNYLAASNGSTLGAAGTGSVSDRVSSIADRLAADNATLLKGVKLDMVNADEMTVDSRSLMNRAASALPPFINAPGGTFTLNPGDSGNIVLDVNGPLINRGSNIMYVEFASNDPNFFLDDHAQLPQLQIDLVGGCLIDTTYLAFGAGGANMHWATNTGRLGTGDWTPHGFRFDGNVAGFYQGTYVYGVSKERIAMNTQDWSSGGGEANAWKSMQGDPNQCNGDCKPALTVGVSLGQISADGSTYTSLTGNMVCRQYIDSVQNFDLGAGWGWNRWTAAFDDTLSMGVQIVSKVYGALDVPAPFEQLNNVVVDYMKASQRYGLALAGWKFGTMIDYDLGSDTAGIDQSISTAWSFTPGAASGAAFGVIKIPFGPGYAPIKNVKAMDADQAQFNTAAGCRANCYWDSVYTYMSQAACISHTVSTAPQDQEFHSTLVEHDFVAGADVVEFAVAHFGLLGVTAPNNSANYAPLAKLVNQWMGFGRGDVNNDGAMNLADIVYLADNVAGSGPGAVPFAHLADVNADGATNAADVTYMVNYYFYYGPAPVGKFIEY